MPRKAKADTPISEIEKPTVEMAATTEPKKRGRKPKAAADRKVKVGHKATAPSVVLQFAGKEIKLDGLVDKAKAVYRVEHPRGPIFNCDVYVKPEEGMAYFVINKVEGKFPLE